MTERLLTARELGELFGLSPATAPDRFERGDPGFPFVRPEGESRPPADERLAHDPAHGASLPLDADAPEEVDAALDGSEV